MYCLATLDSGNFAFALSKSLADKGIVSEVVSIPCKIAKNGCGYCLKFLIEYKDIVIKEGIEKNFIIREIYKINYDETKISYEKIY